MRQESQMEKRDLQEGSGIGYRVNAGIVSTTSSHQQSSLYIETKLFIELHSISTLLVDVLFSILTKSTNVFQVYRDIGSILFRDNTRE